ncbi:MAG TPA: DedA family protein [Herpetosiphonaceae bacterium]
MFETLSQAFADSIRLLQGNVYWLVAGYLLLSEFGTPIPLPGFMVLVAGGYLVGSAGQLPLPLMALAVVALLPGAATLYWVGRRGGQPLLDRLGPRLGLRPERRAQIEAWLSKRVVATLVVVRLLPIVRVSTSLLPGAIGVPWPRYALGMGCALVAWVAFYVGAGYGLARWGSAGLIALPALLAGLGLLAWLWRRLRPADRAAPSVD